MFCKKYWYCLTVLLLVTGFFSLSLKKKQQERSSAAIKVASIYQIEMSRLDSLLLDYPKYFNDSNYALRKIKYRELVRQYKMTECLFSYYHSKQIYETFLITPQFQKRDFGPPFPDNWIFIGPFGIDPDSVLVKTTKQDSVFTKKFIERACTNFRKVITESNYLREVKSMTDAEIFEALRLQMYRISTIGLSNGDFVIEEAGMPGLEGAFVSWTNMVKIFSERLESNSHLSKQIHQKTEEGKTLLNRNSEFVKFNRMQFLTTCLIPLSVYPNELQTGLKIPNLKKFAALKENSDNIYGAGVFNADFFAPGEEAYYSKAKAELGKFLFFDPILSDNNQRACASCHKPELAFTDGNIRSLNFEKGDLPRNAPTVINSGFQKAQFWDLRSNSLEDQLDSVINSKDELHSSFENVIERINSSDEYRKMFHSAFPETRKTGIQRKHVKIAIAVYERGLTGMNSRFDQYVRGDHSKLNASEINGFNVYMGKAKCASCHYAPLFNGALPPYFEFTDHRSIGVPLRDSMQIYEVDKDTGASRPFNNPFFHFSFKVPTVRNVELTAPYMHNGVFKTLKQVVDFYEEAGGVKFMKDMRSGMKGLPFFMILPEKLNLTDVEKNDLVAFMKALTDSSSMKNIPVRLPVLRGKFAALNKRKLGGEY